MSRRSLVFVVALLALVACKKSPSAAPPPPGWKLVEVKEAGFAAAFPSDPSRVVVPSGQQTVQLVRSTKDGVEYTVAAMDPGPGHWDQKSLDALVQTSAKQYEMNGATNVAAQVGGRPGRRIDLRRGQDVVSAVLVAGAQRMYIISAHRQNGELPPESGAFLASFRFIPLEAPPPPKAVPVTEWKRYSPDGSGFMVQLPSEPAENRSESDGTQIVTYASQAPDARYGIDVLRPSDGGVFPPNAIDAVMSEAAARATQFGKGTPGPRYAWDNLPARDLVVTGEKEGRMVLRVIQTHDRLFRLSVIAPQATSATEAEKTFLQSFQLTGIRK